MTIWENWELVPYYEIFGKWTSTTCVSKIDSTNPELGAESLCHCSKDKSCHKENFQISLHWQDFLIHSSLALLKDDFMSKWCRALRARHWCPQKAVLKNFVLLLLFEGGKYTNIYVLSAYFNQLYEKSHIYFLIWISFKLSIKSMFVYFLSNFAC